MINSAGTVQVNESYSAYGYRRSSNWAGALAANSADYTAIASTTRRGYTEGFHEMLDNVGLIHMNGRVYDPVIGRFISPDPIVAQVGNSQAGNSCSYVQNRPLTLTDPTGLVANNPKPGMPCKDNCNGYGIGLSNVASHNAALAESLGGGFMGTESSGIGMWSPGGSVEGMQGSDPFVAAVMADNQARADSAAVVAAGAARDKAITELLSSPACCDWSTSSGGATGAQDGGSSSGGSEGPSGGAGGATSGGLPDVVVSAQKNPSTPQSLTFDITKPFGLNNLGWPSGQIGWKLGHPSPSGGVILRRSVSRGYVVSNGSLWGQSEGTAIWEAWTVLPGGDAPEPCCDQTSFGFPDKSPPPGSLLFGTFQQSAVFYEGMSVPADFNPASTDPYAGAGPGIPWSYTAPILPAAGGTAPVSRTVPFVFQEGR